MFAIDLGKYKNIFISIALFLILDASVLVLNFYISFEIAEDAVSINLAGRQRMLSQRMTKSLFDLNDAEDQLVVLEELALSRKLFDETLNAFDVGGRVTGAGGTAVLLKAVSDKNSLQAVDKGKQLWSAYKEKIDRVLDEQLISGGGLSTLAGRNTVNFASAYGRNNNLALLKVMNDLTVSLERVAAAKAQRLRLIQTTGILMALINFFIILFHFIKQLRQGDKIVEAARKETSEILSTVNEGLFLVHQDFSIGSQRSDQLYDILKIKEDESVNFENLLKDIVSEKDLEAAHGFLRILFNPKVKEKLIGSLNPLEKIQVNIDDGLGVYKTKFLSFDFKRVMDNKKIVDILVSVSDITENVCLEKELEQERRKNENQISMLAKIIHT
ncbi:MAG: type IV pili methyl-accepting chemotaxis transducer N-terminal domain-containing protein, partial [Pseudomonadota bacterium]